MRRRLFNFAAALSLVLFLVMVVLWVRSFRESDVVFVSSFDTDSTLAGNRAIRVWKGDVLLEVARLNGQILRFDHSRPWHLLGQSYRKPRRVDYSSSPVTGFEAYERGVATRFGFGRASYAYVGVIDANADRVGVRSVVIIPIWGIATFAAVLPAVWATRRSIKIRRKLTGRCVTCGYSLTGNTSGICPECGTPVPKEPADKSPQA